MDAHMTYVAMSRHRDSATLYAGSDEFGTLDKLVDTLSRDRMKDTTLAYERTDDYRLSVKEFAERRGIPSLSEIGDMFRHQLAALRERFTKIAERLEAIGTKFAHVIRPEQHQGKAAEHRPEYQPSQRQVVTVPDITFPK